MDVVYKKDTIIIEYSKIKSVIDKIVYYPYINMLQIDYSDGNSFLYLDFSYDDFCRLRKAKNILYAIQHIKDKKIYSKLENL